MTAQKRKGLISPAMVVVVVAWESGSLPEKKRHYSGCPTPSPLTLNNCLKCLSVWPDPRMIVSLP